MRALFSFLLLSLSLSLSVCVCVCVCLSSVCIFRRSFSFFSRGEEGEILTHSLPRSKRLKEGNALSLLSLFVDGLCDDDDAGIH